MANAAVYLEYDEPIMDSIGETVYVPAQGEEPARYEFEVKGIQMALNVMDRQEVPQHLNGLWGFVSRFPESNPNKQDALDRVTRVRNVLGLIAKPEFEEVPELWYAICKLAYDNKGFIFSGASIYLPDGSMLI